MNRVYSRRRPTQAWYNNNVPDFSTAAVFVSAAVFGLLHMNLAQFVYAAVFGVLLAYVTNVTGSIAGAIAAHMAANLTSTLRAELGLFAFADAACGKHHR